MFLGWAGGPWGWDCFNILDLWYETLFLSLSGIHLYSLTSKLKTHLFSSAYWSVNQFLSSHSINPLLQWTEINEKPNCVPLLKISMALQLLILPVADGAWSENQKCEPMLIVIHIRQKVKQKGIADARSLSLETSPCFRPFYLKPCFSFPWQWNLTLVKITVAGFFSWP